MQLITLDFETYYDTKYTLKKMSTSEYIRDNRFKAHGVGIKVNDGPTQWIPHNKIQSALDALDWTKSICLAHHCHFDAFILSERYGIYPAKYACTLALASEIYQGEIPNSLGHIAEHESLGEKGDELTLSKGIRELTPAIETAISKYCINDVDLTYAFYKLRANDIPAYEHDLIDMTIEMFAKPRLTVDKTRAAAEMRREQEKKQQLMENSIFTPQILASNKKFAENLELLGYKVPMKTNAKGQQAYALAKNDPGLQELAVKHPELKNTIEARLAIKSTITETRAQRLINHCPADRHLPIYLKYFGAHTGRWSGGDKLNPQNFTRGGELRKSIVAPDGQVIVVIDLAQIEARVLADYADHTELLEAFHENRDIYSEFAHRIYNKFIDRKLTDRDGNSIFAKEGFVGKVSVLGLGYGMGATKFVNTLESGAMGMKVEMEEREGKRIVDMYREINSPIKNLWGNMNNMLPVLMGAKTVPTAMFPEPRSIESEYKYTTFREGEVELPTGVKLKFPKLKHEYGNYQYWTGKGWSKIYGGKLVENIVQALARIVIAEMMLKIKARYPVVLSTHDEVGYLAPESEAEEAYNFGLQIMKTPPTWSPNLPLDAEGGWARNYSK